MPNDPSLPATKARLGLGYGDVAITAMEIMKCLEYELGIRDARIASLEERADANG